MTRKITARDNDHIISLFRSGKTLDEVMEATGWSMHTLQLFQRIARKT